METNVMIEALADAYRLVKLELQATQEELRKCQEINEKLHEAMMAGSTAPNLPAEEQSTKSKKSTGSAKKSAKPDAKKGNAPKDTKTR